MEIGFGRPAGRPFDFEPQGTRGRVNALMTEHGLNNADIGAASQQVRGDSVA
jgi:hypothetical protein